jgi:23S rRNA pseudouridine1911/1915/1917 synthase
MAANYELVASAPEGGQRLDVFLAGQLSALPTPPAQPLSRARLQALIGAGAVHIDGAPGRASVRVREGQRITLAVPEPEVASLEPVAMPLDVIFEDEHLIVVNKAAHLVVHPGAGTSAKPTLVQGLLAHCQDLSGIGGVLRPGIVHRLDAGTTGLLVAAKNDLAHHHLAEQFATRTVTKGYLAMIWGEPPGGKREGLIDTPYGRHPKHRHRMTGQVADVPGVKRAQTQWRMLGQSRKVSLLAVTLMTGRTHQIRVHMSEMGCAIVGDPVYGQGNRTPPDGCPNLDHQALHAAYLGLTHPVTGAPLHCRAGVPTSWRAAAEALNQKETNPCLD